MNRKGFPESYDTRRLLAVPARAEERRGRGVGAGVQPRRLRHRRRRRRSSSSQPDIVILEGLNVLQVGHHAEVNEFVSDYFDFCIYIDADEADIEEWYVQRFLTLRETVFQNPDSFFRHYADLDRRRGRRHRPRHLARDQRQEPAREHRTDQDARQPAAAQGRRPPRHRRVAAPALTVAARRVRTDARPPRREASQAGSSASEASSVNGSSWSTCSSSHSRWYGTCTRVAAERHHRQDVAAHGVADHAEPVGLDAEPLQQPGVGLGVLLQHDLDVLEVVREPAAS